MECLPNEIVIFYHSINEIVKKSQAYFTKVANSRNTD